LFNVQEGTLKQINKDRNQKTTRNIQEGLPFDINDVKKQTEDAKLLEAVGVIWLSVIKLQIFADIAKTCLYRVNQHRVVVYIRN